MSSPLAGGAGAGGDLAGLFDQKLRHYLQLGDDAKAEQEPLLQGSGGGLLLWSRLDTADWDRSGGPLLEAICRFWQEREQPAGQPLIHWIRISYLKPPAYDRRHLLRHWFWDRWCHRLRCRMLRWRNDQIRRSVRALAAASASTPDALVLPELASVGRSDVEGWVRSRGVRTFLNDQGLQPLEDTVQRFYRDWHKERGAPHIPMETLASFLHQQLARAASRP